MLYILAGRIFISIDFIEGETPDKDCTSELEKVTNLKFSENFDFLSSGASNFIFHSFFIIYLYF